MLNVAKEIKVETILLHLKSFISKYKKTEEEEKNVFDVRFQGLTDDLQVIIVLMEILS